MPWSYEQLFVINFSIWIRILILILIFSRSNDIPLMPTTSASNDTKSSESTAKNNEKKRTNPRHKTVLKMFFLLGMTWILHIFGWGLMLFGETNVMLQILKCSFDLINSLQGVILFCVMFFNSDNIEHFQICF